MPSRTEPNRACRDVAELVLGSLTTQLEQLVLDPDVDVSDAHRAAFEHSLDLVEELAKACHTGTHPMYALRDLTVDESAVNQMKRAKHALGLLQRIHGPQPATCEGGC